ncbi:MAG: citrate synthase [Deltaproteobacteria bacterium]|nr:citrate synthase [Deltaproteobacteria bacterium]
MENKSKSGLEGINVADTRLSEVDGAAGRLIVAGSAIEDLAGRVEFAQVVGRLLQIHGVEVRLGEGRLWAHERISRLGDALDRSDGMDALRAALAHQNAQLPALGGPRAEVEFDEVLRAIGATATYVAAWSRRQAGQPPLAPSAARGHAEDYLYLTRGEAPDSAVRALDAYLVTIVDHGMNASTFAARVAASTGTDLYSALVAGVGTLKGPLHGGAPGPVLDMLDQIKRPEAAEAWLTEALDAGRRIMGMGHRIYRVRDPRAAVLERALGELERGPSRPRLQLARAVEQQAERLLAARHPDRPLKANVEFYTAVLLEAVGLPRRAFTPTFAVGRVAGWCAHVLEQRSTGRLIRPEARYVGDRPQG